MNDETALIERRIEAIRGNLTGIVRELDHRRHDFTDVKGQMKRHAPAVIAAVAVVAGGFVATGIAAALIARRRRARRWIELRKALARVVADPSLLAGPKSPPILVKVAGAALSAIAGLAAKEGGTRAIAYLAARNASREDADHDDAIALPGRDSDAARAALASGRSYVAPSATSSPEPGWEALNPANPH